MGLKRYVKKVKRLALNSNPIVKGLTGGVSNSGGGDGSKTKAVKRLIDTTSQAGGGQITYKTEVEGDEAASAPPAPAPAAPVAPVAPAPVVHKPITTARWEGVNKLNQTLKSKAIQNYLDNIKSKGLFV